MEEEAADSFDKMYEEGLKHELDLKPAYAYISYEDQEGIYESMTEKYNKSVDDHYAKPGHSDYQTGLAICIGLSTKNFAYTKEYSWLSDNAHEYGFIIRYPEGKENITGFEFEPWHFRYVGKEAAKVIHDKNITLEEYYATYVLK
jgi:D-alanyl-D-alanine carboxypeptidase